MPARRPLLVLTLAAAAALIGPPAYATTYCVTADADAVCVTPDVTVTPGIDTLERLVTVEGSVGVTVTCGGPTLDCPAGVETVTAGTGIGRTGANVDEVGAYYNPVHLPGPAICLYVTCVDPHGVSVPVPTLVVDATVYVLGDETGV